MITKYKIALKNNIYTLYINQHQYIVQPNIFDTNTLIYTFDSVTNSFNITLMNPSDQVKKLIESEKLFVTYTVKDPTRMYNHKCFLKDRKGELRQHLMWNGRAGQKLANGSMTGYVQPLINQKCNILLEDIQPTRYICKVNSHRLYDIEGANPSWDYNVRFYLYSTKGCGRYIKTNCDIFQITKTLELQPVAKITTLNKHISGHVNNYYKNGYLYSDQYPEFIFRDNNSDSSGFSLLTCDLQPNIIGIGNSAFFGCKGLTSITIPNSVTSIGLWAFANCTSLTSINIPNNVTSIDQRAFNGCSSLSSINIPNSVTSIRDGAFAYCTSLSSITIPNSVTSIGSFAFSDCTSLTSITIPNSVTSIGYWAFYGCKSYGTLKCNQIWYNQYNTLLGPLQNWTKIWI